MWIVNWVFIPSRRVLYKGLLADHCRMAATVIAFALWAPASFATAQVGEKDARTDLKELITVKKWAHEEFDWRDFYSPDRAGEELASSAEQAFLLRISGRAPDIFDGSMFRRLKSPLYVVADRTFALPPGPPEFRLKKDLSEVQKIANETGRSACFVTLKTLGMLDAKEEGRGVVIEYSYNEKRPEEASKPPSASLKGESEESSKGKISLFGGWYRVFVVRDGNGLTMYEGEMIVY
jgi:hypothetical protein